jgi:hypothetical protein
LREPLTLRDYFAAQAPDDIPDWFVIDADEPLLPMVLSTSAALNMQPGYADLSETLKKELREWMNDCSWELDEPNQSTIGRAALRAIKESADARDSERRARKERRYFAWRWYYADAMLALRSNNINEDKKGTGT